MGGELSSAELLRPTIRQTDHSRTRTLRARPGSAIVEPPCREEALQGRTRGSCEPRVLRNTRSAFRSRRGLNC